MSCSTSRCLTHLYSAGQVLSPMVGLGFIYFGGGVALMALLPYVAMAAGAAHIVHGLFHVSDELSGQWWYGEKEEDKADFQMYYQAFVANAEREFADRIKIRDKGSVLDKKSIDTEIISFVSSNKKTTLLEIASGSVLGSLGFYSHWLQSHGAISTAATQTMRYTPAFMFLCLGFTIHAWIQSYIHISVLFNVERFDRLIQREKELNEVFRRTVKQVGEAAVWTALLAVSLTMPASVPMVGFASLAFLIFDLIGRYAKSSGAEMNELPILRPFAP